MNSSSKAIRIACVLMLARVAPASAKLMEDTVASVNGTSILLSEYQKETANAMEYWSKANPGSMSDPDNVKKLRESTLEQLIDREVLYQEGLKMKLKVRDRDIDSGISEIRQRFSKDDSGQQLSEAQADAAFTKQMKIEGLTYEQFRERLGKQIMARKVIDEAVKSKIRPPDEKTMRAYFKRVTTYIDSNSTGTPKGMAEDDAQALREIAAQVKAMSSERVRVSRILIKLSPGATPAEKRRAFKTTQDIRRRLLDNATSFAEIARSESEDPQSAALGGDIGYVLRGITPPAFEKVAFSLPVGDISEPIETEIGYNVIRVFEKRAASTPEFETFKDDLAQFLANVQFHKDLETFVKSVKDKAVIERNIPPQ